MNVLISDKVHTTCFYTFPIRGLLFNQREF